MRNRMGVEVGTSFTVSKIGIMHIVLSISSTLIGIFPRKNMFYS